MNYVYLVRLLDDNSGITNCNFGVYSSKKKAQEIKKEKEKIYVKDDPDIMDDDSTKNDIVIEKFKINMTYKV